MCLIQSQTLDTMARPGLMTLSAIVSARYLKYDGESHETPDREKSCSWPGYNRPSFRYYCHNVGTMEAAETWQCCSHHGHCLRCINVVNSNQMF